MSDLALAGPPNVRDLVSAFLDPRSANTRRAYAADLDALAAQLALSTAHEAATAILAAGQGGANAAALRWRTAMIGACLASSTINRRLTALRSIVKLARMVGLVTWAIDVPGVRSEPRRDMRGPTVETLSGMMAEARQRTDPVGLRNLVIMRLLTGLGLRRAEVVSLDVEHVDLAAGTITVLRKGHRERTRLDLTPAARRALDAWQRVRPGPGSGPLFVALDPGVAENTRLSPGHVYRLVREAGCRQGVMVSPHRIRHSAVTAAVRASAAAGVPHGQLVQFSGHRSVATLQRYIDAEHGVQGRIAQFVSSTFEPGEDE